ncbi:hypothetical protein [Enterovirga sp.]|jgi:hypothetical protein|uniref:hypothetical protein n=1 Tax=Enterovirga sp. TaxID=2026350 RepID=UPI002608A0CB|nr:hypothetical protein [Enterovirga sp.]MDB5591058.1 hypothetical protein [Enterovirga sp.]
MTPAALARLGVAAALLLGAAPALAQFNPPASGWFGAEDGYNDDGFGWGPAYRPETTFRPSYGFYGGVERPYPYGAPGQVTGSVGPRVAARRRAAARKAVRRPAARRAVQSRAR